MTRSVVVLALAAGLVVACSKTSPPPSKGASPEAAAPAQTAAQPNPTPTSGVEPAPGPAPTAEPQAQRQAAPGSEDRPSPPAGAPKSPSGPAARPSPPPAEAQSTPPPAPPKPAEPPAPKFREVTIPAGTSLSVTVLSSLASNTSKVEDPVKGSLAKPVVVDGATVLPAGSQLAGSVTDAKESGRVKGKASVAFQFDRVVVRGTTYQIQTARVLQEAAQDKKSDVKKGGAGAGLGAIVGGVAGGGKGAAIGAVAGGATGVLATKGKEVQLEPGTVVSVLLQEPVTVTVPVKQ